MGKSTELDVKVKFGLKSFITVVAILLRIELTKPESFTCSFNLLSSISLLKCVLYSFIYLLLILLFLNCFNG